MCFSLQRGLHIQGFTLNAQYREGTIFFLSPASHEIMRYCVTHGSHTASCSSVVCDLSISEALLSLHW